MEIFNKSRYCFIVLYYKDKADSKHFYLDIDKQKCLE